MTKAEPQFSSEPDSPTKVGCKIYGAQPESTPWPDSDEIILRFMVRLWTTPMQTAQIPRKILLHWSRKLLNYPLTCLIKSRDNHPVITRKLRKTTYEVDEPLPSAVSHAVRRHPGLVRCIRSRYCKPIRQ